MSNETPLVGIILGSKSDLPAMEGCTEMLEKFGVPYELVVHSAHRNPEQVAAWAKSAEERGLKVIIGAAGKAAALVKVARPLPQGGAFEVNIVLRVARVHDPADQAVERLAGPVARIAHTRAAAAPLAAFRCALLLGPFLSQALVIGVIPALWAEQVKGALAEFRSFVHPSRPPHRSRGTTRVTRLVLTSPDRASTRLPK